MSLSTLTRYLRLRVRTDLSLPASQNLQRLDDLGFSFAVDENDNLEVRSRGNLVLKPEATQVGGSGSGGELHLGSSAQPIDIKMFASSFALKSSLGIENASGHKVSLAVDSSQASDKTLTFSVPSNVSVSFESSGSVVTDESLHTLTNKSISGSTNLLTNINYTSLTGSPEGIVFPSYSGNNGKYLGLVNGSLTWSDVDAASGVTSVNGQTGDVTLTIPDEYTDGMADARVSAGIAAVKGQPSGLASLDGNGKLPTSQLPSLAISSTSVVSSEAAMLALSAEEGDVAIRTDNGKTYLLSSNSPSTLADWKEIVAGGAVTSVNGQTGTVSLSTSNITEGTNKYYTVARGKADLITSNLYHSDTELAPTIGVVKSYSKPNSHFIGTNWMATNSFSIFHEWGTKDVAYQIFDLVSGEQIVVDNVTWGEGNNTIIFTLPEGITAGSWRINCWKAN